MVLLKILKSGEGGWTDRQTNGMCENSDHYRPWLWVGLVDQKHQQLKSDKEYLDFWTMRKLVNDALIAHNSDYSYVECNYLVMTYRKSMLSAFKW